MILTESLSQSDVTHAQIFTRRFLSLKMPLELLSRSASRRSVGARKRGSRWQRSKGFIGADCGVRPKPYRVVLGNFEDVASRCRRLPQPWESADERPSD